MIEDRQLLCVSDHLQDSIHKLRSIGKVLLAYAAVTERFNKPMIEAEREWDERVDEVAKYVNFRSVLRP